MPRLHDQNDKALLQNQAERVGADAPPRREQLRGAQGFAEQEAALSPHGAVQMKGSGQGGEGVQAAAARGVAGPGQALPYQQQIQAAFGAHDVSNVQAHTDARAADASRAMGANAYATGDHVAFGGAPDLFTAAHEAAHTVQQRAGVSLSGGVGKAGDAYEQHADAVAARVVQGRSAADLLGPADKSGGAAAGVQRSPVQMDQATAGAAGELLPGAKAASAVAYNKGKGLKPAVWAQVAAVVGASGGTINEELVRKIAAWQQGKGLAADGKVGDITMQWLSMEPAGQGLDALVKSNDILYLGMNPGSRDKESAMLAGQGAKVTAIKGSKKQGEIAVDGADVNLGTEDGLKAFVESLKGLPDGKKQGLTAFLKQADFMAKDELAEMARQLYRAETGQCLFKRVVLSGHSGGWSFWGDDNGFIPFASLAALHRIFPIATGQVEDLCMSACNTGQKGKLDQYKAIFPNVKSIWAYVGYSPDASSGSLRHVGNWEQASRGNGTTGEDKLNAAREKVGRGGGKNDKHVAIYTNDQAGKETYSTDSEYAAQDYETMRGTVDSQMPAYEAAFKNGSIDRAALSTLYSHLQNLVGNFARELGSEFDKYDLILKRTLFLRYWDNVTKHFEEAYGATVKSGYEAAHASAPKWSGMSRDKVLAAIAGYPGKSGDGAQALLVDFLRDLNPDKVPVTWA